jgi:UMF1 family MFS transporter
MYDFANSGYTTVVLTTIFNAYFVSVIAAGLPPGTATFLWTLAVAVGNGVVLVSAPVVGAISDAWSARKRFLLAATTGCVIGTALLGWADEGMVAVTVALLIVSLVAFGSGEYLIAAFLPEIAPKEQLGRVSGYGWALGYFGGLLTLALCLAWVTWAQDEGMEAARYVPVTLWITAGIFAVAAAPTFLVLRERPRPGEPLPITAYVRLGFRRVADTLQHAHAFRDLFRFLISLVIFQAGIGTVIVLAAIYAQEVLSFSSDELIIMIMVVNVAAAAGAFGMGHLQDRIGSLRSLSLALAVWIVAILLVLAADEKADVWLPANLIGMAMGATQSAGRALVGHFSPAHRTGEFFGLWGLATHLAMIIGPTSYGLISWATDGDHRTALFSTLAFFVAGLVLVNTVNEDRGRAAAVAAASDEKPKADHQA